LLRDFSVLQGGWDAIKLLGTDRATLENLVVDTNRGGIDVDCCQHVQVVDCTVNSPDDAICLKSSYALGYARITSEVDISNCNVSGSYVEGTVIDGTRQRMSESDPTPRVGRIKLGTESNGGFQHISITDSTFDGCWGLTLSSVDGAVMQDINVRNLTMTDLHFCPVFIRLGARMRGPSTASIGAIRRVSIKNVSAFGSHLDPILVSSVISGIPGFPVESVALDNLAVQQRGTGTKTDAMRQLPEQIAAYPDVTMFGTTPSNALYARHVRDLQVSNAQITTLAEDDRPAFFLIDVGRASFTGVQEPQVQSVPTYVLQTVGSFCLTASPPLPDICLANVQETTL
jgi:polygalacturonase